MEFFKDDIYQILADVLVADFELIKHMNEKDDLVIYGLDSVSSIQLIVKLEDKYEIEFQDVDLSIERINTLDKLFCLLQRY